MRSSSSGSCCCSPPAPSAAPPSRCSPRASAPEPAPNRAGSPNGSTTSPRPAARSRSSPTASTSTTPPTPRPLTAGLERIAAIDGVIAVVDPWSTGADALRASDGRAALAVVTVIGGLDEEAEVELAHEITDVARDLDAPEVLVGGNVLVGEQFGTASENDLLRGEAIALPIAFVAMIFLLGGLRAAGMPFLVALAGVITSLAVLVAATVLGEVSIFSINVVNMLGIGLGIDYGLLMVNRFREERGHGRELHDAVVQTVATAGTTVVFSALTVAVAMCGLFVFGVPILSSFGIAGLGVVLLCMTAAVTLAARHARRGRRQDPAVGSGRRRRGPLLPAHPLGAGPRRRRRRRRRRRARPARRAVPRRPVRDRRRPHPAPVIRGPNGRAHPRRPVPGTRHRPGHRHRRHRTPTAPSSSPGSSRSRRMPGVVGTADPAGHAPTASTVVDVTPAGTSQGDEASALVAQLRGTPPTFDTQVGGIAAELIDVKARLSERLPFAALMVVVATLVLLFLMTGSIIVPIKAVIMNILSLGASFGALVWIFQEGHLAGLLGFDSVGALDLWMPVLILIFAFGLSMDYEVFLLSRIKEVHDETGDNDLAVAVGLQRSGRIITSAAFLIVIVFAGFAAGEVLAIKQLGVGLAIAVLVDATIVRTLLVPATMKLLGERNWWAPAPVASLPPAIRAPRGADADDTPPRRSRRRAHRSRGGHRCRCRCRCRGRARRHRRRGCQAMNRKLTAIALITAAVLTNAGFTVLGSVFSYPDILKEPAGIVFERFREHQGTVSLWFAVLAVSAALFGPIAIGVGKLRSDSVMRLAVPIGIAAAVVQAVGLSRWPLLVPGFAADAASANATTAADAVAHFRTANTLLGTVLGETLGYILTAAWTLLRREEPRRSILRSSLHLARSRLGHHDLPRRAVPAGPRRDRHRQLRRLRVVERLARLAGRRPAPRRPNLDTRSNDNRRRARANRSGLIRPRYRSASPRFVACAASSARVETPSLANTWLRCTLTVPRAMNMRSAICGLVRPGGDQARRSVARSGVRLSQPAVGRLRSPRARETYSIISPSEQVRGFGPVLLEGLRAEEVSRRRDARRALLPRRTGRVASPIADRSASAAAKQRTASLVLSASSASAPSASSVAAIPGRRSCRTWRPSAACNRSSASRRLAAVAGRRARARTRSARASQSLPSGATSAAASSSAACAPSRSPADPLRRAERAEQLRRPTTAAPSSRIASIDRLDVARDAVATSPVASAMSARTATASATRARCPPRSARAISASSPAAASARSPVCRSRVEATTPR